MTLTGPGLQLFLQLIYILLFGELVPEHIWHFGPFVDGVIGRIGLGDQVECLILVMVLNNHTLWNVAPESDHFLCLSWLGMNARGAH